VSLAHAQPVVIRLPDATELPARVDGLDGEGLRLVLPVAPEAGLRHAGAVVEYYTPTGIHRIAGVLEPDGPDPAVVRLRPDGEEVEQRRDFARVDGLVPADVRALEPEVAFAATVALNVSGGGALIQDPIGLPLGAVVRLDLRFDERPITVSGRIVRETADGAKGICLDAIAEPDRERIVRWVQGRQLAELRLRRDRERAR
jgi:PilZ domain-containing protein